MKYNNFIELLRKKSSGFLLYILITILVLVIFFESPGWLERIDLKLSDLMYRFRGNNPPGDQIVIVTIDDKSTDRVGKWPWSREKIADLVYSISLDSPKVLFLDLSFSQDVNEDTLGNTEILADLIREVGNVILPIHFNISDIGITGTEVPQSITLSAILKGKNPLKIQAKEIYFPALPLIDGAADFGHVNLTYDFDKTVRKEPLLIYYDGYLYPSASFQIAKNYLEAKPDDIKLGPGKKLGLKDLTIPFDKNGNMLIDFCGPERTFKYYSAKDVLGEKIPQESFRNRIVLVGLTTVNSRSFIRTPTSPKLPSVEKIANAVENIIHKNFVVRWSSAFDLLLILLIGAFCGVIFPSVSLSYRMVILTITFFVLINLSIILFFSAGVFTKPVYPLLELLFFSLAAPSVKLKELEKKKKTQKLEDLPPEKSEEAEKQEKIESEPIKRVEVEVEAQATQPKTFIPSEVEKQKPTEKTTTTQLNLTQFGRYKIIQPIGKGAMGMVYKGEDPAIDRLVALKTIRLDFVSTAEEKEELKQRLLREAQAAGRLSHPNIVTVYDVGQEGDLQYIAMEYLKGYPLTRLIKKKSELNYKIAARIIIQICDALSYAHRIGVIHRDIKPSNIMILDNFEVKVMDFGIARLKASELTQDGVALGTPYYISPEQLQGKPADKRSDIFSLGIVLYEFLTRKKPFQGEEISSLMYNIINENPPPPSSQNEKTPLIFDNLCAKALAKDPLKRFQDASEISNILREFVSSFIVSRSFRI